MEPERRKRIPKQKSQSPLRPFLSSCRANIKQEDLFSYVEFKEKFVNEKNLKRAHFQEAISQIEAALSGEGDPSPISTQAENGAGKESSAVATATTPAASTTKVKSQAQQPQKTETAAVASVTTAKTAKQRKVQTNAQSTTRSKGSSARVNQVKDPTPPPVPPLTPPPEKEASSTTVTTTEAPEEATAENIMTQMQAKPTATTTPDEESPINPTSRSGRKIKPKK